MKISAQAQQENQKLINEMQQRWKEEERMLKEKTALEYFKEIKETTKVSFEVGSVPNENMFLRGIYKTGDGDYVQPLRPGSEDHKKWKSKGLLASTRENIND